MLTAKQKDKCLNTCAHIFQQAEVEENFIKVIIMVDEMWVYKYDIKIKQQSSQLKSKSSLKKNIKQQIECEKSCCFSSIVEI